ncbi:MAG: family transposase [Bacteroidetes bacterium]|nr:family transposase [Bacteroidota bacterium]
MGKEFPRTVSYNRFVELQPLKSMDFHERIFGTLFGNKGYIGKDLFEQLFVDGVHLVTKIKKNMKNSLSFFRQETIDKHQ